jgi:hypothetical protein
MTRKNTLLVLLGFVAFTFMFLSFGTNDTHLAEAGDSQEKRLENRDPEKPNDEVIQEIKSEVKTETSSSTRTDSIAPAFLEKIENFKPASLQVMREEIAKNPHVAPKSGIASALEILDLFKSIQTKDEASLFLTKMKDCSEQSSDTTVAVKSTCLKYSRRLLAKFPEMKNQVEEITSVSSERAIEMQKMFDKAN